jgi:hypothetical protein
LHRLINAQARGKSTAVIPGRREVASPESITTIGGYGFRACAEEAHPGMTVLKVLKPRC